MGNPVSKYIRSVGDRIIEKYYKLLSPDFDTNKDIVNKLIEYEKTLSPADASPNYDPTVQYDMKKLRNRLAGYITHEYNKIQKEEKTDSYCANGSRAGPNASRRDRKNKKYVSKTKQSSRPQGQLEHLLTSPRRYQ